MEKNIAIFPKAEDLLRQTLDHYSNSDRYAAAQCLALDGICEKKIIKILLNNYFNSNEQVTKEQVTKSLSDLSANNVRNKFKINDFFLFNFIRDILLEFDNDDVRKIFEK
jgi:hypothetical protein